MSTHYDTDVLVIGTGAGGFHLGAGLGQLWH